MFVGRRQCDDELVERLLGPSEWDSHVVKVFEVPTADSRDAISSQKVLVKLTGLSTVVPTVIQENEGTALRRYPGECFHIANSVE